MNVNLTPELDRLVKEKVKSGMYGSASEVVREALRRMLQADSAQAYSGVAESAQAYATESNAARHRETMKWIRERQKARGHVPPAKEEVDAYIRKIREGWSS